MNNYNLLKENLKDTYCIILEDEPMSKHTTFKIGGQADIFIKVNNQKDLQQVLKLCLQYNMDTFILGRGSNLLVSDLGIRGVVIKLEDKFCDVELLEGNKVHCGAGASLAKLCMFALNNSLSGLEFAWGIPGSVGGAAYMNAGAYNGEMKDVILNCTHITPKGVIETVSGDDLKLSYRHSVYSDNDNIILSVVLQLKNDLYEDIRYRMDDFMQRRKSKQPLECPSAGSVFKRPIGHFAGQLIEQCGLKGKSVGGAMVSDIHAGFIINKGNGTCRDGLDLIDVVKTEVKSKTGVSMQCEVKPVGDFS